MQWKTSNKTCLFFLILLLPYLAFAADAISISRDSPENLLRQTTDELLAVTQQAAKVPEGERGPYYDQVSAILKQVIDQEYFARGVMATYGSSRLYKTLKTDAEKEAFKARIKKFTGQLEQVLMATYADALFGFNGEKIDIENMAGSGAEPGKANLMQIIYGKNNTTYHLQYNLQQQKDNRWLITNVIVEGVNLGVSYRNQFAEAVERNGGNVDYVVDNWVTIMNPKGNKPK